MSDDSTLKWDDLESIHRDVTTAITNNARLIKELLKHEGMASLPETELTRIANITSALTIELLNNATKIYEIHCGKSGIADITDFDKLLSSVDLYQNLAESTGVQYATITTHIHNKLTELKDTQND